LVFFFTAFFVVFFFVVFFLATNGSFHNPLSGNTLDCCLVGNIKVGMCHFTVFLMYRQSV
jgi:hypothetical protein